MDLNKRTVGNRRSDEELKAYKEEKITTKFTLKEQKNFKGSDELLKTMQNYERAYREGRPMISDEEWDKLVKETGYEESLDETVSPNGRRWLKMLSPLPSLQKVTSIDDLRKYHARFNEGTEFIVSPKLDGLTYNARYCLMSNGCAKLESITTRGDGLNGLELNSGALDGVEILGLPKIITRKVVMNLQENGYVINGVIEVRGEALINKHKYFEENNVPESEREAFVPRSIAAGMFNSKDAATFGHLRTIACCGAPTECPITDKYLNESWESLDKASKKMIYGFGVTRGRTTPGYDKLVSFEGIDGIYISLRDSWIRVFSLDDMKYRGKLKKLHLYFVSFSMSNERGNIDDGGVTLSSIPGVLTINDIEEFGPLTTITKDIEEIIRCVDAFYGCKNGVRDFSIPRLKSIIPYPCDGIVVKPIGSDIESQCMIPKEVRGSLVIPKYPKDQVAIKLPTDPVRTRILSINKKTTSLGNVTVSADVEPVVAEGGTMVKCVNLHNEEWLALPENSWIQEGVECNLQLSMDIIPIISPIR